MTTAGVAIVLFLIFGVPTLTFVFAYWAGGRLGKSGNP